MSVSMVFYSLFKGRRGTHSVNTPSFILPFGIFPSFFLTEYEVNVY